MRLMDVPKFLLLGVLTPLLLLTTALLSWLRWDAGQPRDAYFTLRKGQLQRTIDAEETTGRRLSRRLTLTSDSGLTVTARIIMDTHMHGAMPVLLVLGGHQTGQDAVDLFVGVPPFPIVAMNYPYEGPEQIRGLRQTLSAIPPIRRAILDTPASVSLLIDWIRQQEWSDPDRMAIAGVSLGVPFAAVSAARDERVRTTFLVHGAADNRIWLAAQLARRSESQINVNNRASDKDSHNLRRYMTPATLLYWLAYGPVFDAGAAVARISPRTVVIVGATQDERTPSEQTEQLYEAAGEPKVLRWTEGRHVQPGRADIVSELIAIATEFLLAPDEIR